MYPPVILLNLVDSNLIQFHSSHGYCNGGTSRDTDHCMFGCYYNCIVCISFPEMRWWRKTVPSSLLHDVWQSEIAVQNRIGWYCVDSGRLPLNHMQNRFTCDALFCDTQIAGSMSRCPYWRQHGCPGQVHCRSKQLSPERAHSCYVSAAFHGLVQSTA